MLGRVRGRNNQSDSAWDRTSTVRMPMGMNIGATWRIRLNRPCAAAMRPCVKLFLTTCCISCVAISSEISISAIRLRSYACKDVCASWQCRRDLNAYTLDLKIDRVNRLSRILYIVIFASKCVPVIMVALCNRADHYIFALWFLSFFFLSSPNVSGRRLDVYHTSTHGVALVRI